MTAPEAAGRPAAASSVPALLRETHRLLAGRLDGDAAVSTALVATVEAALHLAELGEDPTADSGARRERLQEAYQCTRAAATAARFAVVEAEDRRRAASRR